MMTLKLAWRNIWRNRRRTLITAAAIGLGVASLVFTEGLVEGMFGRMVNVATASMSGDAQVHAPEYRKTFDERLVLPDALELREQIDAIDGMHGAPRAFGNGLIAIGDRSEGVRIIGVEAAAERKVTNWADRLAAGRYLEGRGEVMIGADLARKLEIELDGKVVLTMADISTGEARSELLRVVGLLSTGDQSLDRRSAIIDLGLTQSMMGIGAGVHEFALDIDRPTEDRAAVESAIAPLAADGREVVAWHEVNRMLAQAVEMQGVYMGIFIGVIFFIISFGIINTLAMSLAERMHEFGVLRALGTTPGRLGSLILTEAACIGLVGAIPGALFGAGISLYFASAGIDMSGTSQYGVTFTEPLYAVFEPSHAIINALIFAALTVFVAGISAWRAARVQPVEAMRR